MIYIHESFPRQDEVVITVDGILNCDSIGILRDICHRHLGGGKKVQLNLHEVVHISREGRDLLRELQKKMTIIQPRRSIRFKKDQFDRKA